MSTYETDKQSPAPIKQALDHTKNSFSQILKTSSVLEYINALIVLGILAFYSIAFMLNSPYKGFSIGTNANTVDEVFIPQDSILTLQEGDRLTGVGSTSLEDNDDLMVVDLLQGLEPGEQITLDIERSGTPIEIIYTFPGPNLLEVIDRISYLWVPFIIWGIGVLTSLLLRPKDTRWALIVAMCYITAVWIMAGLASSEAVKSSSIVFKIGLWVSIPIYLHLHWAFPRPLSSVSRRTVISLYGIILLPIAVDLANLLPPYTAVAGLMLAVIACLIFIVIHLISQPDQHHNLRLFALIFILSALPTFIIGFLLLLNVPVSFSGRATYTIPMVFLAYFYIIARQQMAGMELRVNRTLTLFVYGILIFSILFVLAVILRATLLTTSVNIIVTLMGIVFISLVSIWIYPKFQRLLERRFLSIPLPLENMVEDFTNRITTSLDETQLVNLLINEIFPSFLIRQAVLIRVIDNIGGDNNRNILPILMLNNSKENIQTPASENLSSLLSRAGIFIPESKGVSSDNDPFNWIRLVLPLQTGSKLIGLCFFGRRDPEDFYSRVDIRALQTIINQTTLALLNIDQAKRLLALYQNDIERHEEERRNLARDLHDTVLGDLAVLAQHMGDHGDNEYFYTAYNEIVQQIRYIIQGLRPPMLNYGLRTALDELVDELYMEASALDSNQPVIELLVPRSQHRYPPEVELHIFRILQQACRNAIKHSNASFIRISGSLMRDEIDLNVEDNGIGFNLDGHTDLDNLLAEKHYGLAGMYERAERIGSYIDIISEVNSGTTIQVNWRVKDADLGKSIG